MVDARVSCSSVSGCTFWYAMCAVPPARFITNAFISHTRSPCRKEYVERGGGRKGGSRQQQGAADPAAVAAAAATAAPAAAPPSGPSRSSRGRQRRKNSRYSGSDDDGAAAAPMEVDGLMSAEGGPLPLKIDGDLVVDLPPGAEASPLTCHVTADGSKPGCKAGAKLCAPDWDQVARQPPLTACGPYSASVVHNGRVPCIRCQLMHAGECCPPAGPRMRRVGAVRPLPAVAAGAAGVGAGGAG